MQPNLSIIIPCYNYAHYLAEALDSILQQDYSDYEVILIDDASSDNTWDLLQQYASRYRAIRIFKNITNKGIFKSVQRGCDEARGIYYHFFACDDLYQPKVLSKIMGFLRQNPSLGLVCADIAYFQDGTNKQTMKKLLQNGTGSLLFNPKELIELFQKTDFWIPGTTCVVKAELVKKHPFFDPQLENISDWFYFHKMALLEGVGYIPEIFVSMRVHDQAYTSQVKKNKKRRRATYHYLLHLLASNQEIAKLFNASGLLTFIFRELGWKLRLNPRYFKYHRYLKK